MRNRVIIGTALISICLGVLTACQKQEPITIGFLGGLSGKSADLGVAGRNGVQLAVEQRNAAGGIDGRSINLVVRDDEQNAETAQRVTGEFISRNVELVIGPMTSSMAMAVVPLVNASATVLLSPTVTTTDLTSKDDNFLRVCSVTANYASKSARYQYEKRGTRTVAVIYDTGNKSYTDSWLNGFRTTFTSLGGKVVKVMSFQSGRDTVFLPLAKELLAAKADSVLIISNAVDSAMISQQLRSLAPSQQIVMSEWASTERFIEMAGTAAEGIVVSQFIDRNDTSQRYRDFLAAYRARFNQDPGFAGVAGYDAALIALEAYARRKPGESVKNYIIGRKVFQGVQQSLTFDSFGDADRNTFITVIRGNQYVTVE